MTTKKLSDLKPADYNSRKIKDKALEGLKYSIDEFGDISGITFNKRTGNLVCAHQRKKALEMSGDDYNIELIEHYAQPTDKGTIAHGYIDVNGERFNYREVDWSLEKEKAANIAANAPSIQGEFTPDVKLLIDDISLNFPELSKSLSLNEICIPISFDGNVVDFVNSNEEWAGLPVYEDGDEPFKLVISFDSDIERRKFLDYLKIDKVNGKNGKTFSVRWPLRDNDDVSSLRFE